MVDHLRSIAVTVEEPAPGAFYWLLLERRADGQAWDELKRSQTDFESYRRAVAEGLLALQGMIDDLDAGPRQEGEEQGEDEDEDADPVGKPAAGPSGFGGLPL
ncbi:hypothetical protein J7E62_23105 [Variovorax paradoxus]|nr:hypothetical protein [Variovorax paradoxus]